MCRVPVIVIYVLRSTHKTDRDIIRENHQFVWEEGEEDKSWDKQLAKKYYDKLFKEYCLADLSRYKENKVCKAVVAPVNGDTGTNGVQFMIYFHANRNRDFANSEILKKKIKDMATLNCVSVSTVLCIMYRYSKIKSGNNCVLFLYNTS